MVLSQVGEDFTVQFHILFLEVVDELAVREAEGAGGGTDFDIKETPKIIFLVLAVSKSVGAGVQKGGAGFAGFGTAAKAKTLHLGEQVFAAFDLSCSFFDS